MADIVSVMRRAENLNTSPQFDSYSRVKIYLTDSEYVTAGDDTGRTLEIKNPWGTQQMAEDILAKLQGYQYQPYTADGALLDPAAEIGDGVSVGGTYGGIYQRATTFSRLMRANISAPEDKEINHEYKYQSPTERKYSREIGEVRASLLLQNNMIEAKVDSTSDNQSFGWQLLQDHWSIISSGNEIFRVDENGGSFAGEVVASSGRIGGFTITASAIYNNLSEFGGTQSTGVYIGPDGIQLGQGFRVNAAGHMECENATVRGTIYAKDILSGNSTYGYIPGSGIAVGSISLPNLNSYIQGGIGGGIGFNGAIKRTGGNYPEYFKSKTIVGSISLIAESAFTFGGYEIKKKSALLKDSSGKTVQIQYLGWGA